MGKKKFSKKHNKQLGKCYIYRYIQNEHKGQIYIGVINTHNKQRTKITQNQTDVVVSDWMVRSNF